MTNNKLILVLLLVVIIAVIYCSEPTYEKIKKTSSEHTKYSMFTIEVHECKKNTSNALKRLFKKAFNTLKCCLNKEQASKSTRQIRKSIVKGIKRQSTRWKNIVKSDKTIHNNVETSNINKRFKNFFVTITYSNKDFASYYYVSLYIPPYKSNYSCLFYVLKVSPNINEHDKSVILVHDSLSHYKIKSVINKNVPLNQEAILITAAISKRGLKCYWLISPDESDIVSYRYDKNTIIIEDRKSQPAHFYMKLKPSEVNKRIKKYINRNRNKKQKQTKKMNGFMFTGEETPDESSPENSIYEGVNFTMW